MSDATELVSNAAPAGISTPAVAQVKYDKVGGWLAFFCITLIVLNPLVSLGMYAFGVSSLAPLFGRYPVVAAVTFLDVLLGFGIIGFSIFAGISLWKRRPGAVKLAQTFLYVGFVYTLVSPFFWLLPGIPRDPNASVLDTLLQSWRGVVYYALWLNYLRSSKRVKATYEEAGVPA